MKRRIIAQASAVVLAAVMLTGCGGEADTVAVIGGADGPTAVIVGEQAAEESEYEDFFRELYADELNNKYTQLTNDWWAFDEAYYSEDTNIDDVITTAEKCISTLEAMIAIEPPATLASYHQSVIDGAQYEIEYYEIILNACLMSKGEASFSEQEIEEMSAFVEERANNETLPLNDAFNAVMAEMGLS